MAAKSTERESGVRRSLLYQTFRPLTGLKHDSLLIWFKEGCTNQKGDRKQVIKDMAGLYPTDIG
ncbi:MAG: hypothetical protein A2Y88_11875 [Chloroflexi bacterium RBG_13_48_10]|nr:MAG: hypothetical protein A2Y88_11875 [Chloroflexi bacterium RBG_13_48_10]